jgi:hypothetical protein
LLLEFYTSLPIRSFSRQTDVLKLLWWFLCGQAYIWIQVENGELSSDHPLTKQRKLISIDSASAVAVLSANQEIDILRPGFYCLEKQQTIYAIFDLRIQSIVLPSEEEKSDPLKSSFQDSPEKPAYLMASTQDGYQIDFTFLVLYKYDIDPGQGDNPYGFDAGILQQSLQSHSNMGLPNNLDQQKQNQDIIQDGLQSLLQTLIAQHDLLALIPQDKQTPSAFSSVEKEIRHVLTSEHTRNPTPSQEKGNPQPLPDLYRFYKESGLKILDIHLLAYSLAEETDLAVQHHWQPHSAQYNQMEQQLLQHKANLYRELGEAHALYTHLKQTGRLD